MSRKVLFVCHNHPDLLVGGVEMYTRDLYEALRDSAKFEPVMLARAGRPYSESANPHPDAPISMVNRDPNEYLLYTEFGDFDHFFGRLADRTPLTVHFERFLRDLQPDVVHFQHTAYLGYDIVRVTRNVLPRVPIVYSLHEYLPICFRDGQMVRVQDGAVCREETPRRCHECFPAITPQQFFLRKRFIQSHFSLVDRFIAPSEYVKDRYVQWGLDPGRIDVEPQGVIPPQITADTMEQRHARPRSLRNRFGYFGQLNPYKGADTLLAAIGLLGEEFEGHLWLYGANLDKQAPEWQGRFSALIEAAPANVTFAGSYKRADLAALMARVDWVIVPSAWWETGPLVVWEAFQHKRPVICSDIGGQSEKVTDGVNGLHFRRGDSESLARAMERAVETPGLWEQLRNGIPDRPGYPMEDHAATLEALYESLLGSQRPSKRRSIGAETPTRRGRTRPPVRAVTE
jgi:glycosyltransferase involved in cell wall biosynthesis